MNFRAGTVLAANFFDQRAGTYDPLLREAFTIEKRLPDAFTGLPPELRATVVLGNQSRTTNRKVNTYGQGKYGQGVYGGGLPLLSAIAAVEDPMGRSVGLEVYDLDASSSVMRLDGLITSLSDLTAPQVSIDVLSNDTARWETLIPTTRVLDLYPNAPLSDAHDADPPPVVPWGVMRKARLVPLDATYTLFGLIYRPPTGTLTVNTVYAGEVGAGRVVTDYTVLDVGDYYVIKFAVPRLSNGRPLRVWADLTSTQFSNSPATATSFVLSDPTHMLGLTVNASSFTTAASDYSGFGQTIAGGLDTRIPAKTVLQRLLLHGAYLDRDSAGAITETVDKSGLHTAASIELGEADQKYQNWRNCDVIADQFLPLDQRYRVLTLQGLQDPGFGQQPTFLVKALRDLRLLDPNVQGKDEPLENPYIANATTAGVECAYRALVNYYGTRKVAVKSLSASRALGLNQLVNLTAPRRGFVSRQFMIERVAPKGQEFELGLRGYSSTIFSDTSATTTTLPGASILTDYSFTRPAAVTSFVLNGSATILTTSDGKKKTLQPVKANAPAVNVDQLWFRAVPTGAVEAPYTIVPVSPGDVNVACTLEMQPGIVYVLECYAFNSANDASTDAQLSLVSQITSHTATGDTTPPSDVTIGSASAGTGKSINVPWTKVTDADLKGYVIFRGTSANPTTEYDRSLTNSYTDVNVAYGTTYHYRVKAVDNSGNLSANYSGNTSATVSKVTGGGSGDIGGTTIDDSNILSLSAAKITTGTLTVANSNGASEILIKGGASAAHLRMQSADSTPAEIRFENTSATIKSRIIGNSSGYIIIHPETDGGSSIFIGSGAISKRWASVNMVAEPGSGNINLLAGNGAIDITTNGVQIDADIFASEGANTGTFWIKDYTALQMSGNAVINKAATGALTNWCIEFRGGSGTVLGYIPVYPTHAP